MQTQKSRMSVTLLVMGILFTVYGAIITLGLLVNLAGGAHDTTFYIFSAVSVTANLIAGIFALLCFNKPARADLVFKVGIAVSAVYVILFFGQLFSGEFYDIFNRIGPASESNSVHGLFDTLRVGLMFGMATGFLVALTTHSLYVIGAFMFKRAAE